MSGHSKWSSIKHKKAIVDARRGKLFSRLSAQISIAAKSGADSEMNPGLRTMIEKAKSAGMGKENIERAIKRGSGELGGAILEEIQYETFGPGGTAFLIQTVTDNKNRIISEIKSVLGKFGGSLAGGGSVDHLFLSLGKIEAREDKKNREDLELAIIESGAEDYEIKDGIASIYTSPSKTEEVKKFLANKKISVENSELIKKAKNMIELSDNSQKAKNQNLLEALNDLDDVTQIWSNVKL